MKLQGIFVDTATPFDHSGDLYRIKIEHNIAKWNRTSVAGYVVGGYTGEGTSLAAEEKVELWKLVAAAAAPEKLLIAGVDCVGVREAVALADRAAGCGFTAALVETPHGERSLAGAEIQLLYFRSVADRAKLPILISNRPAATGVELGAGTLQAFAKHPNIGGVVDHSGECERIGTLADLPVLWGEARSLWAALQSGAAGATLSLANAIPYAAIALWEAYRTREEEAGLDWQARIAAAAEVLDAQPGPGGIKHAMDLNGYYGGPPRLPWTAPGAGRKTEIERALADLKS